MYGSNSVAGGGARGEPPRALTVLGQGGMTVDAEERLQELFIDHAETIEALHKVYDTEELVMVHPLIPKKTLKVMCPHTWEELIRAVQHHGFVGLFAPERHHKTWSKSIAIALNILMGIPTLLLISAPKSQGSGVADSVHNNILKLKEFMPVRCSSSEGQGQSMRRHLLVASQSSTRSGQLSSSLMATHLHLQEAFETFAARGGVRFLDGTITGWRRLEAEPGAKAAWTGGQLVLATYKNTSALRHARNYIDAALDGLPVSDRFYSVVVDEGDLLTNVDAGTEREIFNSLTGHSPMVNAMLVTASPLGVDEYLRGNPNYIKLLGRPCEHLLQHSDIKLVKHTGTTFDKLDGYGPGPDYYGMVLEFMHLRQPAAQEKSWQVSERHVNARLLLVARLNYCPARDDTRHNVG